MVSPTTDVFARVSALKSDTTTNGRQGAGNGVVPTSGNLPPGCSLASSKISVTKLVDEINGYDLSGIDIDILSGGIVNRITECYSNGKNTNTWVINVRSGGRCKEVSWCTFDGGDTDNVGVMIQGSAGHGVELITRNRFLNLSEDTIKPTGSNFGEQVIEFNYYGPPKAWPNIKANWLVGTSYDTDEVARKAADGKTWISKIDGNVGNTLPTGTTSDTNWQYYEPHADFNQWIGDTLGGVRIRRNYMDFEANDYNGGCTTAVYIDPPGVSQLTDDVFVYENIILASSTSSFTEYPRPFIVSINDTPWPTVQIYNNWLSERSGYDLMTPGTVNAVEWGDNWDFTGTARIAVGDSRLPGTGLAAMGTTPALAADWPDESAEVAATDTPIFVVVDHSGEPGVCVSEFTEDLI